MTTTAPPPAIETVVLLPVDQCHKSPSQPRRRGEGKPDEDFVASIQQKGVIQPIVVRKRKAGGWEIVYGHRRHAGSALAKRDTIPAIVRELTDDEMFELQLIENVHRQDMHPLDEADGFKRMVDRGRTPQQVADTIGRHVTYVAQRLKLCELGKETRAALDKEEISLGVAVLVARVPATLQAEAFGSLYRGIGVGEAKKRLEESFFLRLDQAPFDLTSVDLVSKAGACTACPKRTGQQRELFPDAARADLCIDRVCYRGKLDAVWQIKRKEAEAGGKTVLEGKAAAQAIGYGGNYAKLDDEEWVGDKRKKIRTLFGKDLPPTALARDEKTGAIVELVKAADVDKVLKRRTPEPVSRSPGSRQDARDRLRAAAVTLAVAGAVDNVKRLTAAKLVWLLTHALTGRAWNDSQQKIIRRRGLEPKDKPRGSYMDAEERLLRYLKTLTKPDDVAGLGLELVLQCIAPGKWNPAKPLWGETLTALGVDFAGIEKKVAAEAKVRKAAGKKAATTKKKGASR